MKQHRILAGESRPAFLARLFWAFVVTGLLLSPARLWAQTVSNGGFEAPYNSVGSSAPSITGQVANGWSDNSSWQNPAPTITYSQETSNKHGGASCQKIVLNSGALAQFVQYISTPVTPNKEYTVTVWMRAASPLFLEVLLRKGGDPYTTLLSKTVKLTATWRQFTFKGVADSVGDGIALIAICHTPGVAFWIDDMTFTNVAAPAAPGLPTVAPTRSYFGLHINNPTTPTPAFDYGTRRLWDSNVQWAEIETSDNVYDSAALARLDNIVNTAQSQGVDLIYTFGRTPQWASARPSEASPYGPGQAAEPQDIEKWREYLRFLGNRYKGKIKYWEIWNEPNYTLFFTGTPDKLVQLGQEAYNILKSIDSTNQILSPSAVGAGGIGYLDCYLSLGGKNYCDLIGFHLYCAKPEEVGILSNNLRRVLEANGQLAKPVWNTEQGWELSSNNGQPLPDEMAKAYIARAFLLSWRYDFRRFAFYGWDYQYSMALVPTLTDRTALSPAGIALGEVKGWMDGNKMTAVTVDANNTWTIEMTRPDSKKVYAVWNTVGNRTFTIPTAWGVTGKWLTDRTRTPLSGNTVPIGVVPLLLEPAPALFKLTARHSGKCLDVYGYLQTEGATIHQWDYVGGANQQWTVEWFGSNVYLLRALHSGKVATISGASQSNGAPLQQYDFTNGSNQKFFLFETDSGYVKIIALHSGKCLDVSGASQASGAIVQQYDYGGSNNQQWLLTPL